MKKVLPFLAVVSFILMFSSCKTSSHTKCDAYSQTEEVEYDIYKAHNESMQKYVTTSSLR